MVTRCCRVRPDLSVTWVSFYHDGKELGTLYNGTELSLSPLQLNHSSRYSFSGRVLNVGLFHSVPVEVTVHGAQTTQLLVEPHWTPAVLWDRVTLTCQGSGTSGATTWYKDVRLWWQEGRDNFTVIESGTYQCYRPGTGLSTPHDSLRR
ncbi:hypothetical protein TURU_068400 [Turdus rufiventris]|nr:hypothetical protein TURU_068400 [Turdus rufiventris]